MDFYRKMIGRHAEIIHLPELDVSKFHIDIYNDILKNINFWNNLQAEKVLIIQDDGIILREGCEDFLDYDYIGAPWIDGAGNEYLKSNVNREMVGNGGLSIRNVNIMKQIVTTFEKEKNLLFFQNINRLPEDAYFCMCLSKMNNIKMPLLEIASRFASEQIINMKTLGIHKFWAYHHPSIVSDFLDKIIS
jgi:hypothetical protein